MKAAVGYSDKTIEQVREEIDKREADAEAKREAESKGKRRGKHFGGGGGAAPVIGAEMTKSQLDGLAALQAAIAQAKSETDQT